MPIMQKWAESYTKYKSDMCAPMLLGKHGDVFIFVVVPKRGDSRQDEMPTQGYNCYESSWHIWKGDADIYLTHDERSAWKKYELLVKE